MINLKKPLNYMGLLHEAGTLLTVTPELADKLVKAGSAERYVARKKEEPAKEQSQLNNETLDGLMALEGLLKTTNKKSLLAYTEHAGVKDIHERMKNEDIVKAIVDDAREKGIALEGMTDEQLIQFAWLCGIEAMQEGSPRDEMLDTIKKHFEEKSEPPKEDGK